MRQYFQMAKDIDAVIRLSCTLRFLKSKLMNVAEGNANCDLHLVTRLITSESG